MLKKGLMFLVAVTFFGLGVTAQITPGTYVIENVHFANQVLEVQSNGDLQLANITKSDAQKWHFTDVGNGLFRIEYTGIGDAAKCLDASASNNNKVQLWNILGSSDKYGTEGKNQLWKIVEVEDGTYKLQNGHYPNRVLDASMGTTGKVQLWEDVGNSSKYTENANNQKWRIEKL